MNNSISLCKIISSLSVFNPEYKISSEGLIDAVLKDDYEILECKSDGIQVKHFINGLSDYRMDAQFEPREFVSIISELDFDSEKFKKFGITHGLCDCPKCKKAEDILYSNY